MNKHDDTKGSDSDASRVEALPAGRQRGVRRTIGRMPIEDSVSITEPSPLKKGARSQPRASVGLRTASPATFNAKAVQARSLARDMVRESKETKRQRVWDKLDAARKLAQEKRPRLDRFNPKKDRS